MTAPTTEADLTDVDVLVVGAGLSGIDAAYRIQESCPELTYAVVEARDAIGGTWDLFRYPGIRSDSDVFTLALPFHPWRGDDAIVSGAQILEYLHGACRRFGIDRHVHLRTRLESADWRSDEARWHVRLRTDDGERTVRARFLMACTGYYDYEQPYDAQIPGLDDFAGAVVHPQFWPDDLDCAGRRVAIIGSGATAITLVPALADLGASVTMVQRTPTYVLAQPRQDPLARVLQRRLPASAAHRALRVKNTALQWGLYQACRRAPGPMRSLLRKGAVAAVGSAPVVDEHLAPPYDPWDQRLCIAPDGDFFAAVRGGRAEIVTGTIDRVVPEGIRLSDGTLVEADVVVTATGLAIKVLGGARLSLDGVPTDAAEHVTYLGAMLDGIPNLAFSLGYINLSWTVRADMTARLVARVLRRLVDSGSDVVVPVRPADIGATHPIMDMPSGYLARGAHLMPRAADRYPWTMRQDVVRDAWSTNRADLDDGLEWRVVAR